MDVLGRLPALADYALSNLHANAERLERAGSPAQRALAADLLPAIKAELAGRRAAKLQRAAQARRDAVARRVSERKAAMDGSSA
jgi:hypothetical protein